MSTCHVTKCHEYRKYKDEMSTSTKRHGCDISDDELLFFKYSKLRYFKALFTQRELVFAKIYFASIRQFCFVFRKNL